MCRLTGQKRELSFQYKKYEGVLVTMEGRYLHTPCFYQVFARSCISTLEVSIHAPQRGFQTKLVGE